jgi:hypothetical protein
MLVTLSAEFISAIRGCFQKFPDWPPETRTANGTVLCHYVQLYHYSVSQSSEFCLYNPLCCFSTNVYCCCLFRYRLGPETFGYILICFSGFVSDWRHLPTAKLLECLLITNWSWSKNKSCKVTHTFPITLLHLFWKNEAVSTFIQWHFTAIITTNHLNGQASLSRQSTSMG